MSGIRYQVSVVVVSFNSARFIEACLLSIYEQIKSASFEIIVVDNNSSDDTVDVVGEKFPEVHIIRNAENNGFGAANNQGARVAQGDYLFFLNPDTELLGDVVKEFLVFSCQLLGGNLVDAEGEPVFSYGNLPSIRQQIFDLGLNKIFSKYYQRNLAPALSVSSLSSATSPHRVGYICGADLFVKKDLFDRVGGFDEEFFMYWEEVDFQKRCQVLGIRRQVVPEAKIVHHESTSTQMESGGFNFKKYGMLEQSKYLYFRKHYGKRSVVFLKILQVISLLFHTPFTNQSLIKSLKITFAS